MFGEPLEEAVILFDGRDLGGWRRVDGGGPPDWPVADGAMTVGNGDIVSEETYGDAFIHLEFNVPLMPDAQGQARGNSGVFLQGLYEIQVLDSYGWDVPGTGDCGALYDQYAPLVNACRPPETWQTYDIIFRAPRVADDGSLASEAQVTVLHNGRVIHNNRTLDGPTGSARSREREAAAPGPLRLQDHGDPVRYRNIWLVHVPEEGSSEYGPQ